MVQSKYLRFFSSFFVTLSHPSRDEDQASMTFLSASSIYLLWVIRKLYTYKHNHTHPHTCTYSIRTCRSLSLSNRIVKNRYIALKETSIKNLAINLYPTVYFTNWKHQHSVYFFNFPQKQYGCGLLYIPVNRGVHLKQLSQSKGTICPKMNSVLLLFSEKISSVLKWQCSSFYITKL